MADVTVRCRTCGTEYTATRADSVYCSDRCRKAGQRGRNASDAQATIGGVTVPVTDFTATSAAFGVVGHAQLTIPHSALADRQLGDFGPTDARLSVCGERIFDGALERLTRAASGVTITAVSQPPPADVGVERVLAVQDLAVTTFGTWQAAPVAVSVRGVQGHSACRVGAGDIGACARLDTRTCRSAGAVEALADRLAATLATGLMSVEATCDDPAVSPGDIVRLQRDSVRDLEFTVLRVTHTFSDDSLTTTIMALHIPPAPIQLERGGFVAIPSIGVLASILPAQARGIAA